MQECTVGGHSSARRTGQKPRGHSRRGPEDEGFMRFYSLATLTQKSQVRASSPEQTGILPFSDFLSHKAKEYDTASYFSVCHPSDFILRWSWELKRTKFYPKSERLWIDKPNQEYKPKTENVYNLKSVFLKSIWYHYQILTIGNANWAKSKDKATYKWQTPLWLQM